MEVGGLEMAQVRGWGERAQRAMSTSALGGQEPGRRVVAGDAMAVEDLATSRPNVKGDFDTPGGSVLDAVERVT